MWIMLNDSFVSIVRKRGEKDLTVRARIKGDLERLFPECKGNVTEDGGTDYKYRTTVTAERAADVIADRVRDIKYDNFKNTVKDLARHDAYLNVWSAMFTYQQRQNPLMRFASDRQTALY